MISWHTRKTPHFEVWPNNLFLITNTSIANNLFQWLGVDLSYFYNVNVIHLHYKIFFFNCSNTVVSIFPPPKQYIIASEKHYKIFLIEGKYLDTKANVSAILHLPAYADSGISLGNINGHGHEDYQYNHHNPTENILWTRKVNHI